MNRTLLIVAVIFLMQSQALAQSDELPKFEVAAEFTTLEREAFSQRRTEPGFGGRFTYNLNSVFSLEGAATSFRSDVIVAGTTATSPKCWAA